MTQTQQLIDYLKENGQISPLRAWTELGIYRISEVVRKIRAIHGASSIKTEKVTVQNRFGKDVEIGVYHINPIFRAALKGEKKEFTEWANEAKYAKA